MASLNKVFLIGNLTRDPEVRFVPSGTAVSDLRLAVSRKFRSAAGEEREETCFVDVVVWGRQAETCGEYLSKGSPLLVDGHLQYDEWEKDGQRHSRIRVVAERTQFIGAPRRSAELQDAPAERTQQPPQQAQPPQQQPVTTVDSGAVETPVNPMDDDDNLPF
ncbi:MAG: single-stranded DNA-binding protein [Verrucomicrobia bacterium]|nr:single-stranded DNA-binding protein [Verrucomicrobiota bacterium]MDA1087952.1 single-stranded DNA-binding protein [Verrucomicrobiota bacterium]